MENWRLSRIEEELGRLKLDADSSDRFPAPPAELTFNESSSLANEDDLTSKIVIRPAYRKSSKRKDDASKAVRHIKEKYDSPNAVTRSSSKTETGFLHDVPVGVPSSQLQTNTNLDTNIAGKCNYTNQDKNFPTSSLIYVKPPVVPDLVLLDANRAVENGTYSGQERSPVAKSSVEFNTPFISLTAFDKFVETEALSVQIPQSPLREPRLSGLSVSGAGEVEGRKIPDAQSSPRPRPPTAPKPFSTFHHGQQSPSINNNVKRLQQDLDAETLPSNTGQQVSFGVTTQHSSMRNEIQVTGPPLQQQNHSPIQNHFRYFDLDPTLLYPQNVEEAVVRQDADAVEETVLPEEGLVKSAQPSFVQPMSASATCPEISQRETALCEYLSMEAHTIQNLANSYNCFPVYGTLKASNPSSPPPRSSKPMLCPPNTVCLSDDDRNQVELFYRSHKSRVFVSRCETNLYFGSARRHSAAVSSRSKVTETPESWLFVKCGIPVLVLDTGESRRQRRLHIILAEKGTGFVLWRDTVDHLTGYSRSAVVGFHTMHLSKDHTKLAGFYFSDSLSATDFFDYLSGLTSDPDDPLLNISAGARKKKDRRLGSFRRKEKRKPIKPEDISLPCCFTHITKLDRNDGLNILETEQEQMILTEPPEEES